MKTALKRLMLFVLCMAIMLSLCSCDSGVISTVLSIDESFSGTRAISFDVKKSDLGGVLSLGGVLNGILGAPTVDGIVETLEKNKPAELSMECTKDGNDAHCVFTLSFANKEEYTSKVAALLGRNPSVSYEAPSEDVFVSGIKLQEDFTSADLMVWASEALKAEYPKYADKVSMSVEKGATVVDFENVQYSTEAMINVSPVFCPLENVVVNTVRYGDNDYIRTVEVHISKDNLERIGKNVLTERFLQPLTADVTDLCTDGWKDGAYVISMRQGGLKDLARFTSAILDGSTVEYIADSDVGAFNESGTLNEHFNFTGFVCNEDRTADATLIYSTTDETKFLENGDGTLAADGKSYTIVANSFTEKDVTLVSETRYVLESIGISTSVALMGDTTVAVVLDYPVLSSRSASELAAAYFKKAFADTGVQVDVRTTGLSEDGSAAVIGRTVSSTDAAGKYSVVFSAKGSPEELTEALSAAFGVGNAITVEKGELLKLYVDNNVTHTVDLSSIVNLAQYGGKVSYTFNGSYTKVRNVSWKDAAGLTSPDVLAGQENKEAFTENSLPSIPFTIKYQYSSLNILLVIIALAAGVGLMCLLMILSNGLNKKLRAKKNKKKENIAIEAVKCVALAALPEEQKGELRELPKELTQRPMVVLEPRIDDGLDEDDDDPESVQIFATTLRLLAITAAVLFFFPFCNIQRTSLIGNAATLSGWNLFYGKEVFGVALEPYRFAIVLLIVPIITLLLLAIRKNLPRLLIPLFVTGASLVSAFYLLQLPDILTARIDTLKTAVNDYVTEPAFQMGYSYSIIIYVILALGGVLLLFSDLSYVLAQRRRAGDKK